MAGTGTGPLLIFTVGLISLCLLGTVYVQFSKSFAVGRKYHDNIARTMSAFIPAFTKYATTGEDENNERDKGIFGNNTDTDGQIQTWNHIHDRQLTPVCDNLLTNMTTGIWAKRIDLLPEDAEEEKAKWIKREIDISDELQDFWIERGITMGFWRPDDKCGYHNYGVPPVNSTWPQVGSWCNARGERPCCTNINSGTCMPASKSTCECLTCVDLRKHIIADVSDWLVYDSRCRWVNYSASEACDVIESSPFNELYFVGDSFMRNMFRTFLMLVTGDPVHGAWSRSMSQEVRERCTRMQQFFWKECRQNVEDMSDLIFKHALCGGRGRANFKAFMKPYYNPKFREDFLNLTRSKLGQKGSLIVLSVGFHMGCVSSNAVARFLGPAVEEIENYYGGPLRTHVPQGRLSGRWPQIILTSPLTIGLLKPPRFLVLQNDIKCGKYVNEMRKYATAHDIRLLDFRMLTTKVHSFDGTHHGMNVNLIKNQILLNYIATLRTK